MEEGWSTEQGARVVDLVSSKDTAKTHQFQQRGYLSSSQTNS